eukprot:2441032-Pleurochrysis_carterae.AAC.2
MALTKTLALHTQSRQHGSFETYTVNSSIANSLHSLGLFNPHSGHFKLNENIATLLQSHNPLLVFPPFDPHI